MVDYHLPFLWKLHNVAIFLRLLSLLLYINISVMAVHTTSVEIDKNHCLHMPCCRIDNDNDNDNGCPLEDVEYGHELLIFPGGGTRCLYSFMGSYSFQVRCFILHLIQAQFGLLKNNTYSILSFLYIVCSKVWRGHSDKLAIFLAGGGACLDKYSTDHAMCSIRADPAADRKLMEHNLRSYTIVRCQYCSGDLHIGNVTRSYADPIGEPIQQRGLLNVQAVLDWVVRQQQSSDALDSKLSSLLLMGTSAGAVGVQYWSRTILGALQWHRAAVVVDSFVDVEEDSKAARQWLAELGVCYSGLLTSNLRDRCKSGRLKTTIAFVEIAAANPNVPYAFIQSKLDTNQLHHYSNDHSIEGAFRFFADVSNTFARYAKQLPNFVVYTIDGTQHGFLQDESYYAANAYGPTGGGKSTYEKSHFMELHSWVSQLPLEPGQTIKSVCEGTEVENLPPLGAAAMNKSYFSYCLRAVKNKTFTQLSDEIQ